MRSGGKMDKKEINEQFDAFDLLINRFSKSAKKFISVITSLIIISLAAFYSIQNNTIEKKEKIDFELRKDFVKTVNESVKKTNEISVKVDNLQEKKLEKKDYIRKIVNDEYQKILKKDFQSVNSVAIEQIEEAVNSKMFDDEVVMKNASNYIVDRYRTWKFQQNNLK